MGPPPASRTPPRLEQSPDLVARKVAGQLLIVPIRNHVGDLDSIYTLNEVGTRLWELVDGGASLDEIVAAICAEFEVGELDARHDAADFLAELLRLGLFRAADDREA